MAGHPVHDGIGPPVQLVPGKRRVNKRGPAGVGLFIDCYQDFQSAISLAAPEATSDNVNGEKL
jgi:hypothetical protein